MAISAHDIFRDVKRDVWKIKNGMGELEIPILLNDYYIPTQDDFLRAYLQSEDGITVEYKGKTVVVPCSMEDSNEMIARKIMQGFAQINLREQRTIVNHVDRIISESVDKILREKIEIKKKNRGKFNATKKRTGKSTEELTHSKNPLTRKRAIFAQNAKKWKKK